MNPGRLQPAVVVRDADGVPTAPAYGDRYHPRHGAALQAQAVFLRGNGLPGRWAGRADFTILETGFGLGQNFLATWQAWRDDPGRPRRLHYVALEGHPVCAETLAETLAGSPWPDLAPRLASAWPPVVAGTHLLDLDDGRVQLTLVWGDAAATARGLDLSVDAYYLDGFAPARNPAMWTPELMQTLARHAAPGATAASWTVARSVRDALRSAGFEVTIGPAVGEKRETLQAAHRPPPRQRRPPARGRPPARALVIGGGLAGGWAAHALVRQGWTVQVLDRHEAPAAEASGNPGGLFHGTVHADDGPHARLHRAAALEAQRVLGPWIRDGSVPGQAEGLLRLASPGQGRDALQALIHRHALPPDVVQALDAVQASERAGFSLDRAAWWFPGGGWIDPGALVRHLLQDVPFLGGVAVSRIERTGAGNDAENGAGNAAGQDAGTGAVWRAFGTQDQVLGEAEVLVLANAADAARLWPHGRWPLGRSRGQVSLWQPAPDGAPALRRPVAGGGYLLRLANGSLLGGATAAPGDEDPAVRDEDHRFNLDRLQGFTGWQAPWPDAGRVAWRAMTPDRLPLVGAVPAARPDSALAAADRENHSRPVTQARWAVREPGLYVLSGLGSRGLTWGPLMGRLLAAWVSGAPMPVDSRLRDAVDPARWLVRQARTAGSVGTADTDAGTPSAATNRVHGGDPGTG